MRAAVTGGLVGVVVGAAVMWLGTRTSGPPRQDASQIVPAGPSAPAPSPPAAAARPGDGRDPDRDALEQCRWTNALLHGRLATFEGQPSEWGPQTLARYREDQLRPAVERWVGSERSAWTRVLTVDCDEYPCLVALARPPADTNGCGSETPPEGYDPRELLGVHCFQVGGQWVEVRGIGAPESGDTLRYAFRRDGLIQTLLAEATE